MKKTVKDLDINKILVSPSVLAADFAKLGEEVAKVTAGGCDLIHLDVMDGHFVPNLTIGPGIIKSIRTYSDLVFDTHLMISDPLKYAESFVKSGSDHITFHLECDNPVEEVIRKLRQLGVSVGISLKPATPAEKLFPYLDQIDLVLIMTVEPGFGGQSFMSHMMPKVKALKNEITRRKLQVHVEVDGGLDSNTVEDAVCAGANMIVAGTSVFRNPEGIANAIAELHSARKFLE